MTYTNEKIRACSVGDRVNLVLSRTRGDTTHHVEASFPKDDAPAVALAILEAAGINGFAGGHDHAAFRKLQMHEADRKREAERDAEDAKVVEFHTAIGANLNRIERHHRDLYNAAREFFEES